MTVATTRPETLLGDTAVAVHPDPAKALADAERVLREKRAAAPPKEHPAIDREIEGCDLGSGSLGDRPDQADVVDVLVGGNDEIYLFR